MNQAATKPAEKTSFWRNRGWPALSLGLLVANSVVFWFRPDLLALWTLLPPWIYALPGLVFAALSGKPGRAGRRGRGILFSAWLFVTIFLCDETPGLVHLVRKPASNPSLRVVSLNCSVGLPEAAAEVVALRPGVVLLQESPSAPAVAALARKLWGRDGGFVWGVDGTILARGMVTPLNLPPSMTSFATAARVQTPSLTFVAVSFRLTTPPFRLDAWNPSAWNAISQHRKTQRDQTQQLLAYLKTLRPEIPVVIAGDCNAPGGDPALLLWQPLLHDAYPQAGRGWCNTFQNDFPILRIDQIWLNQHFQANQLTTHRTVNSDHRMVVCDLVDVGLE